MSEKMSVEHTKSGAGHNSKGQPNHPFRNITTPVFAQKNSLVKLACLAPHPGESLTSYRTYPGAGLLDCNKQWDLVKRGPELPISELSPSLRIGSNSRWIIIGRTSDEPGPQDS